MSLAYSLWHPIERMEILGEKIADMNLPGFGNFTPAFDGLFSAGYALFRDYYGLVAQYYSVADASWYDVWYRDAGSLMTPPLLFVGRKDRFRYRNDYSGTRTIVVFGVKVPPRRVVYIDVLVPAGSRFILNLKAYFSFNNMWDGYLRADVYCATTGYWGAIRSEDPNAVIWHPATLSDGENASIYNPTVYDRRLVGCYLK